MKKEYFILAAFALLVGCGSPHSSPRIAAREPDVRASMQFDPEALRLMEPGAQHQKLEPLAGTWNHTVTFWMKPGDKPLEMHGTTETHWILGKRFLMQTVSGNDVRQPFDGIGITGYDNVRREYTTTWFDSMSTGMMSASGQLNTSTNTLEQSGIYSCPLRRDKAAKVRIEWSIPGSNRYTYSMYTRDLSGKEFKSMQIVYERVA